MINGQALTMHIMVGDNCTTVAVCVTLQMEWHTAIAHACPLQTKSEQRMRRYEINDQLIIHYSLRVAYFRGLQRNSYTHLFGK